MSISSEPDSAPRRDVPQRRNANRPRRRRKRLIIVLAVVLVIVVVLLANAVVVSQQSAGADAAESDVVPVDGGRIHVVQDGPPGAPALVLIHGLGGSTRWWDAVVPALARTHRVIRIDILGHGRSAKPSGGDYSIPEQGRRLGQVLDRLGVRRAVVVGHSTGGYVATSLAEQRPGLVAALALIDSGPRLDAFTSDGFVGKLLFAPVAGQLLWRFRTDAVVRKSLSTAFSRPGFAIPRPLIDDVRRTTYHSLTATSHASDVYLRERPAPARLKPLGKPLLVIFGAQDKRWDVASAADYRAVPGARIELIPGVGHSPMLEDPARTAALLLDFSAAHA